MGRTGLALVALACAALDGAAVRAQPLPPPEAGVDVLRSGEEHVPGSIRAKRLGLITNHTGRAADGTPTLSILRDELKQDVRVLFSPEHGFTGEVAAGDAVASSTLDGIRLESLYGQNRKPTPEMLSGIDTLVFDIQDIGVRFYTYVSTMKLAMEAAAEEGVDFVVLDRPNPLGGVRVEGPVLDPAFASFVGIAEIPLVHGMTAGELAALFKATTPNLEALELEVVRMEWDRSGWRGEWTAPSPNIRSPDAALAYPANGLIEGINVSEGRGTDAPFEQLGAPWISADDLARAMTALELPGVTFEPVSFTPRRDAAVSRPKYADELCHGVSVAIRDRESYEAVRTGLEVVATIRALYPDQFAWVENESGFWLDKLLGTDALRLGIERSTPVAELLRAREPALDAFRRLRDEHLLYP